MFYFNDKWISEKDLVSVSWEERKERLRGPPVYEEYKVLGIFPREKFSHFKGGRTVTRDYIITIDLSNGDCITEGYEASEMDVVDEYDKAVEKYNELLNILERKEKWMNIHNT